MNEGSCEMNPLIGIPSELSEPVLAAAHDLAFRKLVESDLSDREWILFEGRLDGLGYMTICMQDQRYGSHATIAQMNEHRRLNDLIRNPARNTIVQELWREFRRSRS